MADMANITFGRYEIIRELGRGAMGIVYEAHDPVRGVDVALKVMTVAKGATPDAKKRQLDRFNQEARCLAAMSHPGVTHLYDQGEVRGRHYFAMELVRGTTLKDRVHMQGPLSTAELIRMALELCEALAHVHEQGVVHRDVKPDNIMLMSDGSAKLMDFGIAQMIGGSASAHTSGFQGSPAYMSPEQVQGKVIDRRSDIYSLAVTLYEAATGKRAVDGETIPVIAHQVTNEFPPPPAGLPPFMQAILMRALTKDADQRYQYASEMSADLRAAQSGLPLSRTAASPSPPAPQTPAPTQQPIYSAPPAHTPPAPSYMGSAPAPDPREMAHAVTASTTPSLSEFAGNLTPTTPPPPACFLHRDAASTALCTQCKNPLCYSCLIETPTRGILCRVCAYPRA